MIHISHGIYTSVLGKKAIPFEHYAQVETKGVSSQKSVFAVDRRTDVSL